MENASKALLMAAGVLIGILILSLAVYLFVSFGSTSAELHKQNEAQQIAQFNSQFTSYEGKEGITIYDVVTVANLATETNIYYEFPKRLNIPITDSKDNYVSVIFKNSLIPKYNNKPIEKGYEYIGNIDYNELINQDIAIMQIKEDENDGTQYKALQDYICKVEISPTTQRVYKVTFTKNNR